MATPTRDGPTETAAAEAGLGDYLKEAFLFRWNLLTFIGGVSAAALTPLAPALVPLVVAGELCYLAGLVSVPRFRAAIDAKVHTGRSVAEAAGPAAQTVPSIRAMLTGLPDEARERFETLHARCVEMRAIAAGVRGATQHQAGTAEDIRTPGLDRLLWLFLRLLLSKTALDRFLSTMDEAELATRLEQLRQDFADAQPADAADPDDGDDRIRRSLQDSIAMWEFRLDNYRRAKKNSQFVTIELDRIEGKIKALAEMAVNRQDPDFLSSQVDSAAESMRQTEKAVSELQHLTGLADELQEPPPLLETDLREILPQ